MALSNPGFFFWRFLFSSWRISSRRCLDRRSAATTSASASSSSSGPGSSGVGLDATTLDEEVGSEIQEESNGNWFNLEERSSSRLSDIAAGSWESEDDEENRIGDGGNGRSPSDAASRTLDRENGSVDALADDDGFFSEPADVGYLSNRQASSLASSASTSSIPSSTASSKEPIYEVSTLLWTM